MPNKKRFWFSKRRNKPTRKRARRRLRVEELESRYVLSGAPALGDLDPLLASDPGELAPLADVGYLFAEGEGATNSARITIYGNGQQVALPANIGVYSDGSKAAVRTESGGGELVSDAGAAVTLGDFFDIWRTNAGLAGNNANALLSDTQLLNAVEDATHTVQMFVNGQLSHELGNYALQDGDAIVLVYSDNPVVSVNTNFGSIVVELFEDETPGTVANFLNYVNDGDYINSIFHRSAETDGHDFVIQAGGFKTSSPTFTSTAQFTSVPADPPILNEPGLSNVRGTIAMAKLTSPNSATNQFFINLNDANAALDNPNNSGGYTVFGRVLDMTSVDAIASLPVNSSNPLPFDELPLGAGNELVVIQNIAGQGEISGVAFADINSNGIREAGELGIAGKTIYIDANNNGVFDQGEAVTTTDSQGRYLLQVAPGTYTVRSQLTAGKVATIPASQGSYSVTVTIGRESGGRNFGEAEPSAPPSAPPPVTANSSVSGFVYMDMSHDGRRQADESGVPGALITLSGATLSGAAISRTALTTDLGFYSFGNLPAGTYQISQRQPVALSDGEDSTTVPGAVVGNDVIANIVLSNGQSFAENNFGETSIDPQHLGIDWFFSSSPSSEMFRHVIARAEERAGNVELAAAIRAGDGGSDIGTPPHVNSAPVAVFDSYSVNEDQVLTVAAATGVLANDTDADGDALVARRVTGPAHGSLALNANGSFTYAPAANFFGTDTFTYSVEDGAGGIGQATVTINVNSVNDPPAAAPDSYTTNEDTPLQVSVSQGLLKNDTDVEGAALSAVLVDPPEHGTLTLSADGSFLYEPDAEFSGTDTFSYFASDGNLNSPVAVVTINVVSVDDPPAIVLPAEFTDTASIASRVLGESIDFTALVVDPDDTGYVFQLDLESSGIPAGEALPTIDLNTGEFHWTPTAAGRFEIRVIAVNGDGEADQETFVVDILPGGEGEGEGEGSWPASFMLFGEGEGSSGSEFAYLGEGEGESAELIFRFVATDGNGNVITSVPQGGTFQLDVYFKDNRELPAGVTTEERGAQLPFLDILFEAAKLQGLQLIAGPSPYDNSSGDIDNVNGLIDEATSVTISLNPVGNGEFQIFSFRFAAPSLAATPDAAALPNNSAGFVIDVLANDRLAAFTGVEADGGVNLFNLDLQDTPSPGIARSTNFSIEFGSASIQISGGTLTLDSFTDPANGTVSRDDAGTPGDTSDDRLVYTPDPDFVGADSFTYTVTDLADGTQTTATVSVTVDEVAGNLTADDDAYSVNEDQTLTVAAPGVLDGDINTDGEPITAVLFDGPANGELTLNSDGSFTYVPNSNFAGTDSFRYRAADGAGFSSLATVTITVSGSNDPPVANHDAYTIDEDTTLVVEVAAGVLSNDTDVDGNPLTTVKISEPANGTLVLNSDGSFTYTPDANFFGTETFHYQANDGTVTSGVATVTITVNPIDDGPPVAVADSYTAGEDLTLTVGAAAGVISNDTDIDRNTLTAILVEDVDNGTLTLNGDGSFTYTPNSHFKGLDSFSYKVNDGTEDSNTVTVSIDVRAGNASPPNLDLQAIDVLSIRPGELFVLNLRSAGATVTDIDEDGNPTGNTIRFLLDPDDTPEGATITTNGVFRWTPRADQIGRHEIVVLVVDTGRPPLADAEVFVIEVSNNTAPNLAAIPDAVASVNELFEVTVTATDADGDALTFLLDRDDPNSTLPDDAVLEQLTGGTAVIRWTPGAADAGMTFNFSVLVTDDGFPHRADRETFAVTVVTVSASDDLYQVAVDGVLEIDPSLGVLANDTDSDGGPLAAVLVENAANGTVTLETDGSFSYTPNSEFHGTDTFRYRAEDDNGDGSEALVTIQVNSNPAAVDDAFAATEDTTLTIDAAAGVLSNDTDADDDTLTATLVGDAANGTVTLSTDGSFTYVPNANFSGSDSFTYVVSDGISISAEATVTIEVGAENDPPLALADEYSVDEDTTLDINADLGVLANDTDVEGSTITAALVQNAANGTVTLNDDGSFTYVPNDDFHGTDSFIYRANDGAADSSEVEVSITVNSINDDPLAVDDAYSTEVESSLSVLAAGGVLANDTDADNDALMAVLVQDVANGTLTLSSDGSFVYMPAADFSGTDSFTYTATDAAGTSTAALVTITVGAGEGEREDDELPPAEGEGALDLAALDAVFAEENDWLAAL